MVELPANDISSGTKELFHIRSTFREKTIEESFDFVFIGRFTFNDEFIKQRVRKVSEPNYDSDNLTF